MTTRRLLVVDDEPDFCRFVSGVALDMGYEVKTCSRPEEFEQLYRSFVPSVIMLDIVMPGVDGIELIRWLAGENCTARIIVASSYNPRYAEIARELGSAHGLSSVTMMHKPVRLAELRAVLA